MYGVFKFYSRWSLKVFVHSNSLLIMCATLHPVSLQTGYLLDVAKRFYGMWILRKPVEVYLSVVHSMCTATRVQTYSNTQSVSHMGKAQVERQVLQPTSSTPNKRRRGPFLPNGREACRRFNQGNCVRPDCGLTHNCYILLWDKSSGNEECFTMEAATERKQTGVAILLMTCSFQSGKSLFIRTTKS